MNNIILTGMPAAGKSTIGRLLAKKTGYKFLDTDHLIEDGEGKKLSQIISQNGLKSFVDLEERYVLTVSGEKKIIATGGSVVYGKMAMEHLSKIGTIIYLSLDLSNLLKRINSLSKRGVVIEDGKSFEDLFNERTKLYGNYADYTVDCYNKNPLEISNEIRNHIK